MFAARLPMLLKQEQNVVVLTGLWLSITCMLRLY